MENKISITNRTSFISIEELNQVLTFCTASKVIKDEVEIELINQISKIDIAFIAGLILYHREHGTKFKITYNKIDENRKLHEIRQYLKQYEQLYKSDWQDIFLDFKGIYELDSQYFIASNSFAPIIFIDNHTIDEFFLKKPEEGIDENLHDLYLKYIEWKRFANEIEEAYLKSEKSIITELKKSPVIYSFIFTIIYKKINPFVKCEDKGINDPVQRTLEIWEFTKEYVKGIHELAKNITEHSSTRQGMITVRVYDSDEDKQESDLGKVLETYVTDFGQVGIIPNLLKNTYKNAKNNDSKIAQIYEEDLEIIQKGFQLTNFVTPSVKNKLRQQLYRDMAHYGLMKFYQLITKNKGSVVSSSIGANGERDFYTNNQAYIGKVLDYGTTYFFQLPFNHELFKAKQLETARVQPMQGSLQTIAGLSELMRMIQVDRIEDIPQGYPKQNIILCVNWEGKISGREDEERKCRELADLNPDNRTGYIAINMDKLELSPSSLLRFTAHLSGRYSQPIIIYNVDFLTYWEMIKDNELFYKTFKGFDADVPYWYEGKCVLIYSRIEDKLFNFADLLFGKNESDYISANYIISHTFINALTIINGFHDPHTNFKVSDCLKPYFYQSSLLPFDIVLNVAEDKTIFQSNLELLLQQELNIFTNQKQDTKIDASQLTIYNAFDKVKTYIGSMEGYKISHTHFKIGSKIHAEDFFYAKRLFQNSYYTARIAMLLAIMIQEQLPEPEKGLTLVGYEMYSELLLSLTSKFLSECGYKKVNQFVTLDTEDKMKHIPENIIPEERIVIIVPIASTGSTSLKIQSYLIDTFASNEYSLNFPLKPFNVLTAFDPHFNIGDRHDENQKSIINLNTEWHLPINCKRCFDDDCSTPLFETDKTSLIPALIFNYPTSRTPNPKDGSANFNNIKFEKALLYKKVKRNNEYLLFSTDTNILIEENKEAITNWLANYVKKQLVIHPSDKIVLLSPCHYSNTQFINLVNDLVFNSSATIIHYQTDADYISNFRFLYENFLTQEDRKIIFVDDSLISGKTFFGIYEMFKNVSEHKKGLSASIFLSNKSSPDVHERVLKASQDDKSNQGRVFSFVNVNLPILPKVFNKNPLEHEVKRYGDLAESVLHDTLKNKFKKKEEDLHSFKSIIHDSDEKSGQHYKMFKATHEIYSFFGHKMKEMQLDFQQMDFEEFLDYCGFNKNEIEDKIAVMKVLSQYPFLLYMPVRKRVFQWHKKWLNEVTVNLSQKLTDKSKIISYDEFQEVKFLIRRSVFLGNYKILTRKFFTLLALLLNHIGDIEQIEKEGKDINIQHIKIQPRDLFDNSKEEIIKHPLNDNEKSNLKDFYLFLLIQYIEIVQKNPWCADKISQSLSGTGSYFKTEKSDFKTHHGIQFIRMLTIETAIVMNDFYNLINENSKTRTEWINLYKKNENNPEQVNSEIIFDKDNKRIKKFFKDHLDKFTDRNKFKLANQVLNLTNEDKSFKKQFLNYLWVKQLLHTDQQKKAIDIPLTAKTENIFQKLQGFFDNNEKIGAFFIVTDGRNHPHLVYDRSQNGETLLKELDPEHHALLYNFLKGESDMLKNGTKVIIEYVRNESNIWEDQYVTDNAEKRSFINDYKWLLLIRISNIKSQTMGLMGFYSHEDQRYDILSKQLLMLLCKDLAVFIKRHHKNEEFADLREAEATKRFAYLAGHGRQMMQKLAQTGEQKFGEIVGTMEKLQYLFATKYISPSGNSDDNKLKLCKELLKTFYCETISADCIEDIKQIAELIYQSDIIENNIKKEEYEIECKPPRNFAFRFNKEILRFICFELIVNAKKNRFHFTNAYQECFPYCEIRKNKLCINFEITDSLLKITITGSGAMIPDEILEKINTGHDPKRRNEISGLTLIRKLIKILDNNNTLKMRSTCFQDMKEENRSKMCRCINKTCIMYENVLTISIKPIE